MASRSQRVIAVALLALVAVGALVRLGPSQSASREPGQRLGGGAQAAALFRGIPQHGAVLGDPHAPLTLTEFADLQCPFCARYAREVLPSLVRRYVRAGKVRLVFRSLAFIGPDSVRAARIAAAAGLQGRLWQFTDLVFRNQGQENSGYATDDYIRRVAGLAGVDPARAFAQRSTAAVDAQLVAAASEARRFGIDSTPSFLLRRGRRRPVRLIPRKLSVDAFASPIETALRGA